MYNPSSVSCRFSDFLDEDDRDWYVGEPGIGLSRGIYDEYILLYNKLFKELINNFSSNEYWLEWCNDLSEKRIVHSSYTGQLCSGLILAKFFDKQCVRDLEQKYREVIMRTCKGAGIDLLDFIVSQQAWLLALEK